MQEIGTKIDGLGLFTTGLYVMEGSSSDSFDLEDSQRTLGVRDILSAFPILCWSPPDQPGITDAVAMVQAKAFGASEIDSSTMPLASERASEITFKVEGDSLKFISSSRRLGLIGEHSFKVEGRVRWFIEKCETVAVVIQTPSKTYVASVTPEEGEPCVAVHNGNLGAKALESIVERSTAWRSVILGNRSVMAGAEDAPDHHYRTYSATPETYDIPQNLSYPGVCLGCGADEQSNEHCVPNWIATDHKVIPVTAPVFCVACNNYFGDALETPISRLSRSGDLTKSIHESLFALWAVKTSLTLSASCDVRLDESWGFDIRSGTVPEGFTVFADTNANMRPGYLFTVSQFSRRLSADGAFLFSFAMNGLAFVVIHVDDIPDATAVLPRVYPTTASRRRELREINFPDLHAQIMEGMTGHSMQHTFSQPKSIKSKRK